MAFTLVIIHAVLFSCSQKFKKKSHLITSKVQQFRIYVYPVSPIKCSQMTLLRNIHFTGLLPKQQTALLIFFLLSYEKRMNANRYSITDPSSVANLLCKFKVHRHQQKQIPTDISCVPCVLILN